MMSSLANTLQALAVIFTQFLQTPPVQPDNEVDRPSSKTAAVASHQRAAAVVKDNDRFWTAPFVLADLENKEVVVWGQLTGMEPGEPVEFFVISENSGHGYEALMVSFATAEDIHTALEKIGAEPGGSVNPDAHRFWPRGSRIQARVQWMPEGADAPRVMPVEETVVTRDGPMTLLPWVFTGAPMLPSMENEDTLVYGADEYSPNSIASTFNLRNTVFDLPLQGSKTQTYGKYIRNPKTDGPEGAPMLLRLTPADPTDVPADKDLTLHFSQGDPGLRTTGDLNLDANTLEELGAALNQREREYHFLTVDFSGDLTLNRATALAQKIQLLERHVESVRIEPPPEGHLFFQAFVPDPSYRERTRRPSQPIELHLVSEEDALRGTVMELTEIWGDTRIPDVVEERVSVETPEAWVAYLDEQEKPPPVLFVYASPNLPLKRLREWTTPVEERFPIVFVYMSGK